MRPELTFLPRSMPLSEWQSDRPTIQTVKRHVYLLSDEARSAIDAGLLPECVIDGDALVITEKTEGYTLVRRCELADSAPDDAEVEVTQIELLQDGATPNP